MKVPALARAAVLAATTTLVAGLAIAQTTPTPRTQLPPASQSLPVPPPPQITARAGVLMDAARGNVLAGANYASMARLPTGCSRTTGTMLCFLGTLPAGASGSFAFPITLPADAPVRSGEDHIRCAAMARANT